MGDPETQVLDDNLVSLTARLKSSFRSDCSGQLFPCFNKHTLPFELQELILAHLPALKLAELKVVSRSWRDLLQSSRFKENWQSIRGGCSSEILDVWVMKSTKKPEDLLAYIPSMKKYCVFLELLCNPLVLIRPSIRLKLREKKLLCGSGPLLLLADGDWQSEPELSFSIYSLQTCQLERVGRLPMLSFSADGECFSHRILQPPVLIAAEDHSSLYLVLETLSVHERGFSLSDEHVNEIGFPNSHELLIHRSTTLSWTPYPEKAAIEADHMSRILGGYFFSYNQNDSTLYAWSEEHWCKVSVTFPSSEAHFSTQDLHSRGTTSTSTEDRAFKVFKFEGHILLITSMVQLVQGIMLQGFIVWKLVRGEESWNWIEYSRTPHELRLKSFKEESLVHPTFMFDGCRICVISSSHEFFPPLVYDVKHDSWYHLLGVLKNMQALFSMKVILNIGKL